jgi:hypothetical protein
MKKSFVFATLLSVSLVVDAWAAGMGAVQIPFDPDVGWTNLITTASGRLIVLAHLDAGLPNEDFSVSVRVRYEDATVDVFQDIAVLSTNEQGKGNVFVLVNPNPPQGSTTLRRVAVRVRRAPNPLYLAVAWDLPLKPGDRSYASRTY